MSSLRVMLISLLLSWFCPAIPWAYGFGVPQGQGGLEQLKPGPNSFIERGSVTCFGGTSIDTNEDGATAGVCTFDHAQSNLGPVSGQETVETALVAGPVTCPAGNLELTLVAGRGAKRFINGDLLFYEYTSLTNCVDLATLTFSVSLQANFIGGTGRFAGATGSIAGMSAGTVLLMDPAGNGFSALTFEAEGEIILPE